MDGKTKKKGKAYQIHYCMGTGDSQSERDGRESNQAPDQIIGFAFAHSREGTAESDGYRA
jgi:hypothetical protein